MTAPARSAALLALLAIERGRRQLPAELARMHERLTDERDRSLAAAIVSGTLRWQRALDHLIAAFAHRPLESLDREVRSILRLSLYQLLHLDRVPASAVVDDAVSLTRAAGKGSAGGFVNAVLRSTLRQRRHLPLPARPTDPSDAQATLRYLGITCSHPDWLVERWLSRHGFDATERWLQFNNAPAPLTLATNGPPKDRDRVRASLADMGVETTPAQWSARGLLVTGGTIPGGAMALAHAQDEASQLVAQAVEARASECILDLCAAPGGKTLNLEGDMEGRGTLVACDVRQARLTLLRRTLDTAGSRAHVVRVASTGGLPFLQRFDRVLVDAPCSGTGTIRREPDLKWRRVEADLPALAASQRTLLRRAAEVVAPGGRLVYATCSSEPEENAEVVDGFLAAQPAFRLLDLRETWPIALTRLLDDRGRLCTLPFAHRLEAFFAAALIRLR